MHILLEKIMNHDIKFLIVQLQPSLEYYSLKNMINIGKNFMINEKASNRTVYYKPPAPKPATLLVMEKDNVRIISV